MKILIIFALALVSSVCAFPGVNRAKPTGKPPITTPSSAPINVTESAEVTEIKKEILAGMQLLEAMSCGYEADPLSLVLNDHSISNDIYYLNFSVVVSKKNQSNSSFRLKVLTTGPTHPDNNTFPIYSVNFRGDILDSYGYSFPNADNYLSTDYSTLVQAVQENNITLSWGWPFYCDASVAALTKASLVNYIDNAEHIGSDSSSNTYISLGKIMIDNYCFNLLIEEENWTISLVAVRFFVDCDSTIAPYI